jgi:hypothetical protein
MGFTSPPPPPDRIAAELWKVSITFESRDISPDLVWEKLDYNEQVKWISIAKKAIEMMYNPKS